MIRMRCACTHLLAIAVMVAGFSGCIVVDNPRQASPHPVSWEDDGRPLEMWLSGYHNLYPGMPPISVFPFSYRSRSTNSPRQVHFTEDGRYLLTPGPGWTITTDPWKSESYHVTDHDVYQWSLSTGELVRRFSGHDASVRAVTASPDGARLITAGHDGTVRVWDMASGRQLRKLPGYRQDREDFPLHVSLSWSRSGTRFATAGDGGPVRVWDAQSGELIASFEQALMLPHNIELSPDGERIAFVVNLGHRQGQAVVRTVDTGEVMQRVPAQRHAKFCHDGTHLLVELGHWLDLWDLQSGRHVRRIFPERGERFSTLAGWAIAPGERSWLLAVATDTLSLYDLRNGGKVATMTDHLPSITQFAFTEDGTQFHWLQGGWGYHRKPLPVAALSPAPPVQPVWRVTELGSDVAALAFSADGTRLAVVARNAATNATLRLLEVPAPLLVVVVAGYYANDAVAVAITPDHQQVLVAANRQALAFDMPTAEDAAAIIRPSASVSVPGAQRSHQLVATPQGVLGIARRYRGEGVIWQMMGDGSPRSFGDRIRHAAISGDGTTLVYLDEQGELHILDAATLRSQRVVETDLRAQRIALSHDGHQLLLAERHQIHHMDLQVGTTRRTWKTERDGVSAMTITPDNRLAIIGGSDATVSVWSLATGQRIARYHQHEGPIHALTVSPDSRLLAVGTAAGTVVLWALPQDGKRH